MMPQDGSAIPVLAGPTAVGKTEISLRVATALDAEIISADSRQVYRELTIGTAKPSREELSLIPHHFIDERSLDEPFSAGIFAREAHERIRGILKRNRTPLVVGGSTLYLHALIHGLADIPEIPRDVRAQVQQRLQEEGAGVLYAELERVDPVSAASMDATKTQRLVRALEVFYGTGRPLSAYHAEQTPPPFPFRVFVLHRNRTELYARINHRVDAMLGAGLVQEVQNLLAHDADPGHHALQTIGYQEPIRFLAGEISYSRMAELIKQNTRRYAKRQLTWFRRFPSYAWLDLNGLGSDKVISLLLQ